MHVRLVTIQVQPGKIDEAINSYKSVESEWKQKKGFVSAHLGVDRNTGKAVSATVWETLADLQATEASGWYQEVLSRFASMLAGPPTREIYEEVVTIENK